MKIFFFFFYFSSLPLLVIEKNYHLPFFRNSEEKVLKNPAKRAEVSFFTNYVFSAVITRTHTHTLFYGPIMRKNRAEPLFLEITFFLLSKSSPYPRKTS